MKQGLCNRDIFFAPSGGEIICRGVAESTQIQTGQLCSVSCEAAYAIPDKINWYVINRISNYHMILLYNLG